MIAPYSLVEGANQCNQQLQCLVVKKFSKMLALCETSLEAITIDEHTQSTLTLS